MNKYELSTPQETIWDTRKAFNDVSIANVGGIYKLRGYEYNPLMWAKAINLFLENNEVLRTRIIDANPPMQYIEEFKEEAIEVIDLSHLSENEQEKLYQEWMEQTLTNELCVYKILKFSETEHGLFCVKDHIVTDGYSEGLGLQQLSENYINLLKDPEYTNEKMPSYSLFLKREKEYRESEKYLKDQTFWQNQFNEEPTLINLSVNNSSSSEAKRIIKKIDENLTSRVKSFCYDNKISVAVLFEAILFTYLKVITGEQKITIGSPLLNRIGRQERKTIGMFVNTLPFPLEIPDDIDFKTLSKMVDSQKNNIFRHMQYPSANIQKYLSDRFGYTGKLFDIVFSYQNASIFKKGDEKIEAETKWVFPGHSAFGLTINFDDRDEKGEYVVNLDYQTGTYSKKDIENIFERLLLITDQVIENQYIKVDKIDVLTAKDRQDYEIFNYTDTNQNFIEDYAKAFEEQVVLNPDKIALLCGNKDPITYRQLNSLANSLAHTILSYGLPKGSVIPIVGERDSQVIIATMAIAKAGYAFFIIDYNEYPKERINYLLDECNSKLIIKHNNCSYTKDGIKVLDLNSTTSWSDNIKNPNLHIDLEDGCCVFHTSGSTGLPKCALLTHKGLVNFGKNTPQFAGDCEYGLNLSTMSFDAFMYSTSIALLNGRTLVLTTLQEQKDLNLTEAFVAKYPNSFTFFTPAQASLHLHDSKSPAWKNINVLTVGGEPWGKDLKELILNKTEASLFHVYGPTECTIMNIGKKFIDDDMSMGKPLANSKHYVVNKNNRILPPGVIGELVNLGYGLAKGYLNQPNLTAEKFIHLPETGERAYKTGDLVYLDQKLNAVFIGRKDFQIKINGLRIELEEIEKNILDFEKIIRCVVVKKEHNEEPYLATYYVSESIVDEKLLRNYLNERLAYYMVPSVFIKLDTLPLTASGKINRKALPETDFISIVKESYVAPENERQIKICDVWKEVLELDSVGVESPFYSLGGTSRKLIRAKSLIEKVFNIEINTKDLPLNPTIKEIETVLKGEKNFNFTEVKENLDLAKIKVADQKVEGNILLTGATGYLGSHLLWELLATTTKEVYCLIRDERRFESLMEYYFGDKLGIYANRIHLIKGDITKERLGLNPDIYELLKNEITDFVNSAADVRHYAPLKEAIALNVTGVENALIFCAESGACMHHMSTLSVSGAGMTRQKRISKFTEQDLNIGQSYQENSYVWTKYISEKYCHQFREMGGRSVIYRFGGIMERSYDGLFQINKDENGIKTILEAIQVLSMAPKELLSLELQGLEVDKCAEAVMTLMKNNPNNDTYHIYDPDHNYFKQFVEKANISYQVVDIMTFVTKLKELIETDEKYILVQIYLEDFAKNGGHVKNSNIKTVKLLEDAGFTFSKSSQPMIKKL